MALITKLYSRRRFALVLGVLVACGAALRLACAFRCCLGYDEVFVIGVGLDEITQSARAFLIDVPLRRSDGITPLWWWVQTIPQLITGHLSLAGLRFWPLVFGGLTLLLSGMLLASRLGGGPALILVLLAAISDVLVFANARGEYAESLLLLMALPALCLVGQTRRPGLKGLLWLVLLMTHLGKGLFLLAGLLLAECLALVLHRGPGRIVCARRLALSLLIALVPTLGWLGVVNGVAFASGPVMTDAGERRSVYHALAAITFGYADTKTHVVAAPLDAAQLYLDGAVWPVTTILAVPALVGLITAVAWALGGGWRARRGWLVVSLMPWILAGLLAVIARGMVGARFHLLYLPALWTVAAVGLWRLRRLGLGWLGVLGTVWVLHLAVAFSWAGWADRTLAVSPATFAAAGLGAIMLSLWAFFAVRGRRRWGLVWAVFGLLLLGAWFTNGPWRWGPAGRFEPMAEQRIKPAETLLEQIDRWRRGQGPYPSRYDKGLYVSLANYFLEKPDFTYRDLARAVHYAQLDTRRDPQDPRAWFYLGYAYEKQGRSIERARTAYQRSYDLRPEPIVAEALQRLED